MNKTNPVLAALAAVFCGALLLAGCAKPDSGGNGGCTPACGAGQTCQNNACVCTSGMLCGGQCVSSDSNHCGNCTTVCQTGQVCSNNVCSNTCSAGTMQCAGGACANLTNDARNCGSCGNVCPGGATCVSSSCMCPAGQTVVNGSCMSMATGGTSGGGAGTSGGGAGTSGGNAGTSGGGAGTSGGNAGRGGTTGTAGTSGGAGRGGTTGAGGTNAGTPPGYWTFTDSSPSYTWNGCVWTGVDSTVAGSTTNFTMPASKDFTGQSGTSGPYRVAGSVYSNYDSVALLGFNIAQPAATANCTYKPVTAGDPPMPGVTMPSGTTGIAVNFGKAIGSQFRIQIQGPNGATDPNDRWCYNIPDAAGPSFAPFSMFNTKCWDGTGTAFTTSKQVSAIVFLVPGTTMVQPFDFTINGFAAGTSASDAPTGGTVIPITGMLGGPGSTDLDFARVKVRASGKDYIIQNNNWGNPSGSDQVISYRDNSFTVVSSSGTGSSAPASFPSIYIGNNGDTANGSFSTKGNDGLPKVVSSIGSINTTLTVNRTSGDMNVCYDVWFSSAIPQSRYDDAISGFVMVWFYKPPNHQPIGSAGQTVTIGGKPFTRWVGPRGGSGANANAPVVSYVANQSFTNWTFDLKPFITDAQAHGINQSWYLTDVFGGAEIWRGQDGAGFQVQSFTCTVN